MRSHPVDATVLSWHWVRRFRPLPPRVEARTLQLPVVPKPRAAEIRWEGLRPFVSALRRFEGHELSRLEAELERWNEDLAHVGGDCAFVDWNSLRTLRTRREEDWSDWLASLVETSTTGELVDRLLGGGDTERLSVPLAVLREEGAATVGRRADLVLHWPHRSIHLEVKIGDRRFEKTIATARGLEAEAPHRSWSHWILLPEEDLSHWREAAASKGSEQIGALTWDAVASALRGALLSQAESISWQVWAWSFCGTIEQKLLGFLRPGRRADREALRRVAVRWLNVLDRARRK